MLRGDSYNGRETLGRLYTSSRTSFGLIEGLNELLDELLESDDGKRANLMSLSMY